MSKCDKAYRELKACSCHYELAQAKAELELQKETCLTGFMDRDAWKLKAEQLAERLKWTDEALDCIKDVSSVQKIHRLNEEALAAYEGEKK